MFEQVWKLAAFALLSCAALRAQQFEVASIRPSGPRGVRGTDGGPGSRSPERWIFGEATILDLMVVAYDVEDFQIDSNIPLDKETFDVAATLAAGTTEPQFQRMLQNLLAERFRLKLHVVSREFQGYELVLAKSGHKLIASPAGAPFRNERARAGFPQLPQDRPGLSSRHTIESGYLVVRMSAQRQPLSRFDRTFLQTADLRPVVEKTGLTGTYDFTLAYTMESGRAPDGPPPAPESW
jgi:uncharacterized protein (TIGR03435 family)